MKKLAVLGGIGATAVVSFALGMGMAGAQGAGFRKAQR